MRTPFARLALAAAAALTLAACRDSDVVGPKDPDRSAPSSALVPTSPSTINLLRGNPWSDISAGDHHSCARRYYGQVYCWGDDTDGQLGIGPAPTQCFATFSVPGAPCADVPTLIPNISFRQVAAGYRHSCGIASSDATIWCWGANNAYQLGTGDAIPSRIPRATGWLGTLESISAGVTVTCGTGHGTIICWGTIPDGAKWPQPSGVFTPGVGAAFQSVDVGVSHVCGFWSANGSQRLYCWGQNAYGQAGADPATATYVHYTSINLLAVTPGEAPSAGDGFSCVAVASIGMTCFGVNDRGQLGTPAFAGSTSYVPVFVDSPVRLHGVSAGDHHACALDDLGYAWCWGYNDYKQVGSDALGPTFEPSAVPGGHQFTKLAAGSKHTCGIATDGHIWCWGDDYYGQLGDKQQVLQYRGSNQSATPIMAQGS